MKQLRRRRPPSLSGHSSVGQASGGSFCPGTGLCRSMASDTLSQGSPVTPGSSSPEPMLSQSP